MCGRYTYYSSDLILKQFDLVTFKDKQTALSFKDNYNVSPGTEMPVIVRGEQQHRVEFMKWGLVPAWSKIPDSKLKLINARAEGLLEKPIWKRLVNVKRCIVPARGFYEWKKTDSGKVPYYITPKKGTVFSFAGLWDIWTDKNGNEIFSYAIVTTSANSDMKKIHERIPVILDKQKSEIWLEPTAISQSMLDDLLAPLESGGLEIVKVSSDVNNTRNNSEELIYPLTN